LGTFLAQPAEVRNVVARKVADELSIADVGCLTNVCAAGAQHREHAGEKSLGS
jgi:hypothetical protein